MSYQAGSITVRRGKWILRWREYLDARPVRRFMILGDVDINEHPSQIPGYIKQRARDILAPINRPYTNRRPELNGRGPIPVYVYIISIGGGIYKIGRSIKPSERIASISTASPFSIKLINSFFCNDSRITEQKLHKKYAKQNIRGEWFALNDSELVFLKSITEETFKNVQQALF